MSDKMKAKISKSTNLEYKKKRAEKLLIEALSTISSITKETDPDKLRELQNRSERLSKKLLKLAGYKVVKINNKS